MIDEYVKKWIIKAKNDLQVAENEMNVSIRNKIPEAICFHSQQAVEKFLKAFLVKNSIEFGKTHNLEFLLELCSKEDNDFKKIDVGNLTYYAVEVRYPDEFYQPTEDEAEECINIAREVKKFVLKKIDTKEETP